MTILALDGAELDPQSIFTQKSKPIEAWVLQSTGFPGAGYTYTGLYYVTGSPHGTLLAYGNRAANNAIVRSTDGGVTWTETLLVSQLSGSRPFYIGSGVWIAGTFGNNGARYYYSANDGVSWTSYQALTTSGSSIFSTIASNGKGMVWAHVQNPNTTRYHTGWGSSSTWTTNSIYASSQACDYNPIHDDWLGSNGAAMYRTTGTTTTFATTVTWSNGSVRDIKACWGYYFVMTSNGSIYRTPGPLGATTTWTQVYSQASISITQAVARHFVQDNAGRLWAFVPDKYLIYTTNGTNWTSITPPASTTYIAQYQQTIVCGTSSMQIYKWGTPTVDATELITVQSTEARTGASCYHINPQNSVTLLEHVSGAEPQQRIGFAFRYPTALPNGEIPLAAFARSLSTNPVSQARRFNFQLTTGSQSGPTTVIGINAATISASSIAGTRYPWCAMNGAGSVTGTGGYWQSAVTTPTAAHLQLYLGTVFPRQRLLYYTLTSEIEQPQNKMPTSWTVQGSNDGTNWTILDTQTDVPLFSVNESRTYTLAVASVPYSYFRLHMTKAGGSSNVFYCVGDWGLYGIPETDLVSFGEDAFVGLYLDVATKTLRVRGEDGALWAESTATLNPELWYYLEFSHSASAGGSVRLEGAEVCTWTNSSPEIQTLQLGAFVPTSASYYVDDIALSEGETVPGPLKIYPLLPNGDGAYTEWDKSHFDLTRSEILADGSDDTYLSSFNGAVSVSLDDLAVNRNVLAVQIVSRMSKEDNESGTTGLFVRQNATNTFLDVLHPALAPAWHNTVLEAQPNNQGWTPNALNDLEIGWQTVVGPSEPSNLAAVQGENHDIIVTFDPPTFTDNFPVLDYEAQFTSPGLPTYHDYEYQHTSSPMTSPSLPSPLVASASSQWSTTFAAYRAFTPTTTSTTDWCSADGAFPHWTQIDFGQVVSCNAYKISNGGRYGGDEPKAWTLSISDDGSSWTVIDTQTNQSWPQTKDNWKSFTLPQVYTARYWRWTITASANASFTHTGGRCNLYVAETDPAVAVDVTQTSSSSPITLLHASLGEYTIRIRCRTAVGWGEWSQPLFYNHLGP